MSCKAMRQSQQQAAAAFSNTNTSFSRSALCAAGGFDPELELEGQEDTELGCRLGKLGYRLFH